MNPTTCPLAAKQPLADLTAESARNAVKTFEGLDYSPEEASTAAYVEEQITKHSRLGFTQCSLDQPISPKMRTYLERKGFHVTEWWTARVEEFQVEHEALSRIFRKTEQHQVVSWVDPIPAPEGSYPTFEEARKRANELADEAKANQKKVLDTMRENENALRAKRAADLEIAQTLGYKQPAPTSTPSGCLPLLLALPTALYFLLS